MISWRARSGGARRAASQAIVSWVLGVQAPAGAAAATSASAAAHGSAASHGRDRGDRLLAIRALFYRGTPVTGRPAVQLAEAAGDQECAVPATATIRHLDVTGTFCPLPILLAAREMLRLEAGDRLEIVGDDPGILEDMPVWCQRAGQFPSGRRPTISSVWFPANSRVIFAHISSSAAI